MSLDLATLGIAVDTKQVKDGEVALDNLAKAGGKAEQATKSLSSAYDALGSAAKVVASAMATIKLAEFIKDSAMLAARYETLGVVMKVAGNNAGYTASQMDAYSKALQQSGISMMQSRNAIVQLATANIDLAKAAQLGRAAQDVAVVGNINSSEALGRLITGIKAGEVEILRGIGLNVNFEGSYKTLAQSLGTTSDKLTEQQKVTARTNTVIQEAAKYNGIYEESMTTAGKAMTSLTRHVEDFKVKAGEAFLPALATSVSNITDAFKLMNKELEDAGQNGLIDDVADKLNKGLRVVLETIAVLGANVAFVLKGLTGEIATIATQAVALAHGDLQAAAGIGKEWREEAEAMRVAVDKFSERVLSGGEAVKKASGMSEEARIKEGESLRKLKEEEEKRLKRLEEAARIAKKVADEYENLIKSLREKQAMAQAELASETELTAAQKLHAETEAKIAELIRQSPKLNVEKARAIVLTTQAILDQVAAKAQAKKAEEEYLQWVNKVADGERSKYESLKQSNERLIEEIETLGMTSQQLAGYRAEKLRTQAATDLLSASEAEGMALLAEAGGKCTEASMAYRELAISKRLAADAATTQADLVWLREVKGVSVKAADDATKAWEKFADDINRSLTDSLYRAFESGDDFGKAFAKGLVNTFKTMVLKVAVQAVMSPVTDMLKGGSGSSSGYGGIGSAASSAKGIFSGTSGNGLIAAGNALGSSSLGLLGTGANIGWSAASEAAAAYNAAGMAAEGFMLQAGAALPYIGAAIAAYKIIDSITGSKGGPKSGGDAAFGYSGGSFSALSDPGLYTPDSANAQVASLLAPVLGSLNATVTKLGGSADAIKSAALGYDTDPNGSASNRIKSMVNGQYLSIDRDLGRDPAALQAGLATELNRIVVAELKSIDLADWADSILSSIDPVTASADQLSTALSNLNSMAALATVFENIGGSADNLSMSLVNALGGFDSAASAMSGYYDAYFTEAEKQAKLTDQLREQFAALNLEMPTTKDGFKALIDQQMALGDAGAATTAKLLQLSGAFSSIASEATRSVQAIAQEAAASRAAIIDRNQSAIANAQMTVPSLLSAYDPRDILGVFGLNRQGVEDKAAQDNLLASMDTHAMRWMLMRVEAMGNIISGTDIDLSVYRAIMANGGEANGAIKKLVRKISEHALQMVDVKTTLGSIEDYATDPGRINGRYRAAYDSAMSGQPGVQGMAGFGAIANDYARSVALDYYSKAGPGVAGLSAANLAIDQLRESTLHYNYVAKQLAQSLDAGQISLLDYTTALDYTRTIAEQAGAVIDKTAYQAQRQLLIQQQQQAGLSSAEYYFGKLGEMADQLAEASRTAAEPVSILADVVGRLKSSAYVFGESASAIGVMGRGQASKSIAEAIAAVAKDATSWLTTQGGQAVVDQFGADARFSGVDLQKIGPMLDSVSSFNIAGYEQAFIRLSDALADGTLSVTQYNALMGYAKDKFMGLADATGTLGDAISSLVSQIDGAINQLDSQRAYTLADRAIAQAQLSSAVELAKAGGSLPSDAYLSGITQIIGQNMQDQFSTAEGYLTDLYRTRNDLVDLKNIAQANPNRKTTDDVVAELVALRAEVANLRAETQSTARNTAATANILKRVTPDGESLTTSAVSA